MGESVTPTAIRSSTSSAGWPGEQRRDVAVGAEAEHHHVELAGSVLAHRRGVRRRGGVHVGRVVGRGHLVHLRRRRPRRGTPPGPPSRCGRRSRGRRTARRPTTPRPGSSRPRTRGRAGPARGAPPPRCRRRSARSAARARPPARRPAATAAHRPRRSRAPRRRAGPPRADRLTRGPSCSSASSWRRRRRPRRGGAAPRRAARAGCAASARSAGRDGPGEVNVASRPSAREIRIGPSLVSMHHLGDARARRSSTA